MPRGEPIINDLLRPKFRYYFWADEANGFWAVGTEPSYQYKTAFSTIYGQYCYVRMGQGLTGSPMAFVQLKNITAGPIPEPHAEPALRGVSRFPEVGENCLYHSFVDDDYGASETFEGMVKFLHHHYFPRLAWVKLTLAPKKSHFFTDHFQALGFKGSSVSGLRPGSDGKVTDIVDHPTPKSLEEVSRFVWMTTYFRRFLPKRADHVRCMQAAAQPDGSLCWGKAQEHAIEEIRRAIRENCFYGGDRRSPFTS